MPPLSNVATHTFPAPSTASESSSCMSGRPWRQSARPRAAGATSPGPLTARRISRPLCVSAQYSVVPSGARPMPFGDSAGKTTSRIDDPSGRA